MNDHSATDTIQESSSAQSIAGAMRDARISGAPLSAYPGPMPASLKEAYSIQNLAIEQWPDRVAGWKVGMILGDNIDKFGSDRLAGPIFSESIQECSGNSECKFEIIEGGFAAVEAELVFVVGQDAPAGKTLWTKEEAAELVKEVRSGVELAGSPFGGINDHGPAVTVSDFGNNSGLILGPAWEEWRALLEVGDRFEMWIEGKQVGTGNPGGIRGGALESLRFMLENGARRGFPLRAGQVVSSGAVTGVHEVVAGQHSRAVFGSASEIRCVALAR